MYPVVTWPRTLDPIVATFCPHVFNTSYEPLATTKKPYVPVIYSTIDGTTANKCDPIFYTKVPIPCVEPDSQDAVVPAKGRCWLTDSECEALLNCLNRRMAAQDIASQFGVIARYIGNFNNKYGNTCQISESFKAKHQPKLLQPVHIDAIKQWTAKDCHLDTLAVQSMLATEFGLSVSKTLVYKAMVNLGFSWKVLGIAPYNRNSEKTIKDQHIYAKTYLALKHTATCRHHRINQASKSDIHHSKYLGGSGFIGSNRFLWAVGQLGCRVWGGVIGTKYAGR
ncbi:hypothetical protein DSO57_1037207 [Entomophthora muscae]|uniref:Uncharacterized protein n=1 Tax=Entomophthora muscae TaxID=34485 RepID=A0ACC2T9Q6_9FUNG|nr:hypothetical protein DSO57_1037207 [Entomophthora muscae]